MVAPIAAVAGSEAASEVAANADDVAKAASDSKGFNIFLAAIGLGMLYVMYRYVTSFTEGVGGAGRATGSTLSGVFDWTGENVADGSVDVARGAGETVDGVTGAYGEIVDETAGGAADIADRVNPFTPGPVIPGQRWF